MTGLRSIERGLLVFLVVFWLACFALFVREALTDGLHQTHLIVRSAETARAFPTVVRHRPGAAGPTSVAPGDQLVRVGSVDLRGAASWTVYAQFFAQASPRGALEITLERDGVRATVSERLDPDGDAWRDATVALVFAATALLIVVRVPGSRMGRSFAFAALVWTLTWLRFPGAAPEQTYAYFGVRAVVGCLWAPLMIRAAYHFPESAWPRGRRVPVWPWLFLALGLTWTSKWFAVPFPVEFGTLANPAMGAGVGAALLFVATRNYRRADALGRRQARWVLLGVYLGLGPSGLGAMTAVAQPELAWLWYASQSSLIAIPIAIFVAITRSNLLDIDRVISSTASYTILLVILGTAALIGVAYAPNRHLFFNREERQGRQGSEDHWWEYTPATRDWVRELGLRVPAGFAAVGTGLRVFESDWMDEPCVVGGLGDRRSLTSSVRSGPDPLTSFRRACPP